MCNVYLDFLLGQSPTWVNTFYRPLETTKHENWNFPKNPNQHSGYVWSLTFKARTWPGLDFQSLGSARACLFRARPITSLSPKEKEYSKIILFWAKGILIVVVQKKPLGEMTVIRINHTTYVPGLSYFNFAFSVNFKMFHSIQENLF